MDNLSAPPSVQPLMKEINYKIINGNINLAIKYDTAGAITEKIVTLMPDHIYKVSYYDNNTDRLVTITGRLDLILSDIEELERTLQTGSSYNVLFIFRFDSSTIYNGALYDVPLFDIRYIEEVLS